MPVLFWSLRTSADTSLYSRGECLWAPLSLIKTWFVSTSSVCASTIYSKNRLIRSADTSTVLGLHTVLISERLVSSPRSTIWIRCASGSMSSSHSANASPIRSPLSQSNCIRNRSRVVRHADRRFSTSDFLSVLIRFLGSISLMTRVSYCLVLLIW